MSKQQPEDGPTEQEQYAKIVAEVKAKYAKRPGHTGQDVEDEIARRWAKKQGVKYEPPPDPTTGKVPNSVGTNGPMGGDGRKPGEPLKINMPDLK